MKKILLITILVLSPSSARAEKGWFGMHLGMGTNFQSTGNLNVGFKVRALDHCPFALEAVFSIPYGFEVMAPLYIFKTNKFKFHLIFPFTGIHIPFGQAPRISVPDLKDMEIYLVMGAGIELKLQYPKLMAKLHSQYLALNLDWRIFMPNPIHMIDKFGDYGIKVIKETFKEGEIWLGATLWF